MIVRHQETSRSEGDGMRKTSRKTTRRKQRRGPERTAEYRWFSLLGKTISSLSEKTCSLPFKMFGF